MPSRNSGLLPHQLQEKTNQHLTLVWPSSSQSALKRVTTLLTDGKIFLPTRSDGTGTSNSLSGSWW